MKSILIFLLLSLTTSSPITQEYLTNLQKTSSFEVYSSPEEHPFKSTEEVIARLGLKIDYLHDTSSMKMGRPNLSLPESFDSRTQWPNCIHPIRNQAKCGSCWAHAASEVLSDRFCIDSNGKIDVVLSPQDFVSCDIFDYGCNGGSTIFSWLYLRIYGLVVEECKPYTSQDGKVEECGLIEKEKCVDDKVEFKKYKAQKFYMPNTVNSIKEDIYLHGPIESGFYVYSDFKDYKSGIYQRGKHTQLLGGHAVKIVGWGKEGDTEYWLVANSWGEEWGEKGYFRIAFGECGIENVISGTPKLE